MTNDPKTNRFMTSKVVPAVRPESTNDLKDLFEQSLAFMCEDKESSLKNGKKSRLRHASLPLHSDAADLQRRALDNAAKALATLWKISQPGRPKAPTRVMLPHRQIS
ncbi:MAG: hypothetical protein ACLPHI_19675 [Terriglobales bacterium]